MRKITLLLVILTASFGFSQNTIETSASDSWLGYINASGSCAGGFGFSVGTDYFAITSTLNVGPNTVVLQPQLTFYDANPGDCAWDNGAGNGASTVEGNTYVENNTLADADLTFNGMITSNNLDGAYTAIAFIKGLDPNAGFADVVGVSVVLPASGNFSITATAAQLSSTTTPGIIIQYGFAVIGLNAPSASAGALGSVTVTESTLSANSFELSEVKAFPNPTNNVWNVKTNNQNIQSVVVYDILGKQVLAVKPNTSNVEINSENLSNGLYFAKVKTNSGEANLRLVKN